MISVGSPGYGFGDDCSEMRHRFLIGGIEGSGTGGTTFPLKCTW